MDFEKPKLECVEMSENYGRFVVEPLERGFGMTLGNPCVGCCSPASPA